MENLRKPFQGIINIIRFNWHFYIISIFLVLIWTSFGIYLDLGEYKFLYWILLGLGIFANVASIVASWYIYDASKLYTLDWLGNLKKDLSRSSLNILNIHAGFDETSEILHKAFPEARLHVFDFYDPHKHTEVSIERARNAYPSYPHTIKIRTDKIPMDDHSIDIIFLILATHEIRNPFERIRFFKECKRILKSSGSIIVLEHLRDIPNFIVYTIGFMHFHSYKTWMNTFQESGLRLLKEKKVTHFLSYFQLVSK